ncbi:VOC family protein [Mycolicibacterium fluoranthenivorans]|uniref:VOC family protein n=1 Tax=Mycolicibacterium fluoranthenivorans TaxID=258505 RepID=A0A7G8PJA9_9MYCO|nr:VOC family protein [Mycolicibacterium fluoranthenivorans]QNJ94425.1 VOC family protein [Mycolicibacterium fluoranthenivorans]
MEILASRMLIRPADYPKSVAFYRDLIGLAVAREYGAGTVFYAGQSLIELAGHGEPSAAGTQVGRAERRGMALWLQVRDVRATQAELAGRGVHIARTAREEPWGLHEMHVTDPDGILLIFVEVPATHPLRHDIRN